MAVAPLSAPEFVYNSLLSELISSHITEAGHECHIAIRNDGTDREGAALLVNNWGADACLELHFNAFDGKSRGSLTIFDKEPPAGAELARYVQNAIVTALEREGRQNRGARLVNDGDRGHRNLSLPKCPAVLVEPFFGDNPADAKLGLEKRPDLAEAMAGALVAFCNKEYGA
jgi:N-acetylmuramoyl-L-alanine amidase